MNRIYVASVCLVVLSSGCGEAQVPARQWCVRALFANGEHPAAGNTPIINNSGNYTVGCKTMCMFEHNIMVEGEIEENIDEMDPLYDHWQFLRGQVYSAAESTCEQWADELGPLTFNESWNTTCADAVAAQSPYLRAASVLVSQNYCLGGGATFTGGTGTGGSDVDAGDGGGTPPSGPEIYGLDSYDEVIDCSGAVNRVCDVDEEFVAFLVENVVLLWQDDLLLEPSTSPPGMKLTVCGSDSLPYALGFRQNDVITSLSIFDVATQQVDNWDMFGHIVETGYEQMSADFVRVGRDHTLTVTQTEFCGEVEKACEDSSDCCDGLICNINDVCSIPL